MASYSNPQNYQRSPATSTSVYPPQNYRQGEKVGSPVVETKIPQQPSAVTTSAPRPFVPRRFNTGASHGGVNPYQAQSHPSYEQARPQIQQPGYPTFINQGPAYYGASVAQPGQSYYYPGQEYSHGIGSYSPHYQQHPSGVTNAPYYHPPAPVTPPYTGLEETKLTERGQEFPFKDMLMARYQQMEASCQFPSVQLLSSESNLINDKVITSDAYPRQPLASTMPFNSEELGAIATGQFVHHQQRRPTGGQHGQRKDYTQSRNPSYNRHTEEGKDEDEEILWGAEPVQTGQLGTFDSSGQFISTTKMAPPLKPIIPTTSTVASTVDSQEKMKKTLSESSSTPAAPPGFGTASPVITSTTQWVYRDPSGVIQGPFLNSKMLEWYQSGYFPDSLPLRRDTDSFFDTLSAWKIKCGGRVPFEATSPVEVRAPPKKIPESKPEPSKTTETKEFAQSKTAELQPKQTSESERFLAGLVTGRLDNLSLQEESKKGLTVEQLEAQIKPTAAKKESPVILQRSTTSDKWETPSNIAKQHGETQQRQVETKTPKTFADLIGKSSQDEGYKPLPIKKPSTHVTAEPAKQSIDGSKKATDGWQTAGKPEKLAEGVKANEKEDKLTHPEKRIETANQVQQWLQSVLASSSQSLDIPTCIALLMEMSFMDEIITFCQDNGIRTGSLTTTRFSQELIARRFGQDVASKQAKTCTKKPSIIDDRDIQREREARGDDSDFVSVKRK